MSVTLGFHVGLAKFLPLELALCCRSCRLLFFYYLMSLENHAQKIEMKLVV
ncbi:hypothetical protein Syun_020645 [Stephania yunnanensis]|uniref:Uncharacterized protein n=1 Tax=Stephania yunnanensis TaxID=152371 RepID=A0AAP0IEA3_9MAGN